MENSDLFGSSTAPLTWHDFLERMRHPSAAEFVKAIKSFIVSFMNNAPDAERDSAAVQDFLGSMETAFRAHSLWAGSSEDELESAGEGLEKYVMTKLFIRVFASTPEDVKADEQLHEKMALVQQFIRPEHLDIKPTFQNETSWLLAQKELQKINMYKAPRDKLVCILNCCKVISNLLVNASLASKEDHPGADEFLPVLIYVTIKANPPQLHSNLTYIQQFRRQTRLVAESAYFFTNMLSVESFIMNIDAKAISMEESEYERNMETAKQLLFGLSENSDVHSQVDQNFDHHPREVPMEPKPALNSNQYQGSANTAPYPVESSKTKSSNDEQYGSGASSLSKIPSISDLENRGASTMLKEDGASHVFRDFPFLYSQAGDLTVGDVEDLLNNYKQLVFKYACLAKGLGVTNPSPRLLNAQCQNLESPEAEKEAENGSEAAKEAQNASDAAKDPETVSEAHATDNTRNDHPSVASDSAESSVFGLENTESKGAEEAAPKSQGEEGIEHQDPQ